MSATAFPFTSGESHIERAHPHIVEHLRLLWGYPEGGRYLAKLIIDSRGGRTGFAPQVMSELLTLATIAADMHLPHERAQPMAGSLANTFVRRGHAAASAFKRAADHSLQPISFQLR